MLPGWYDDFKDETAESVWTDGNNIEDIAHASRYLEGSYIVKDYVKSRKHECQYMIIGYMGHGSFQRCGYEDGSGEIAYPDLDTLFSEELIDGICLERDWYKVTDIWCEPDMDETDDVIEAYRRAVEQRKQEPGDKYHIGCLINYDSSVEKIVKAVSRVFSEAFEPQDFTVEKCMNVAVNIRKAPDDGASIYWSS